MVDYCTAKEFDLDSYSFSLAANELNRPVKFLIQKAIQPKNSICKPLYSSIFSYVSSPWFCDFPARNDKESE